MAVESVTPVAKPPAKTDNELQMLRRLQRLMLQCATAANSRDELLNALCNLLKPFADVAGAAYFQPNQAGEFQADWRLNSLASKEVRLAQLAELACRSGVAELRPQSSPPGFLLAAPILLAGRPPEVLAVSFANATSPQRLVSIVQLAMSHIAIWRLMATNHIDRADADQAAAVVELLQQVASAPTHKHACYAVADALKAFLQCDRVAVGWQVKPHSGCKLAAHSGVGSFDPHAADTTSIESAMNEAVVQKRLISFSASAPESSVASLAHKSLQGAIDAGSVISIPLETADEEIVGALLITFEAGAPPANAINFLQAVYHPLATALSMAKRLDGGWFGGLRRKLQWVLRGGRKYAVAAALLVGVAALFVPAPHHLHGDCQIEPVTRRFVAAPFESTLKHSLVRPGDLVKKGQTLAELDDRELRWKRAAVVADRNQAIKQRDAAQVARKYAEQQIAQLDIERLDLELQLLDHRAKNLTISSPIDGVVAAGDLDRAEGAPLTIGQSLFEIAPLESMVVESSIEDNDIAYATQGQRVTIRLDAYPGETWESAIKTIEPRSEIVNERNVFIAATGVANTDGRLRPGMRGKFVIEAGYRPLGWILFHKPWETVARYLIW